MMFDVFLSVGFVTALTQVIKISFPIKERYIPLVAIGLGIALSITYSVGVPTREAVGVGILSGLASIGLYSGPKAIVKG